MYGFGRSHGWGIGRYVVAHVLVALVIAGMALAAHQFGLPFSRGDLGRYTAPGGYTMQTYPPVDRQPGNVAAAGATP